MPTTFTHRIRLVRFAVLGAAIVLLGAWNGSVRAADMTCDRACLQGTMDKYLEAMVAHDPTKAPFADNVKFTENGQELTLQDALWATASDNSTYRLYVLDPESGGAGFLGLMKENGSPVIIAVRLKVVDQKIAEAEQVVSRPAAGGFADVNAFDKPFPILMEKLKPEEKVSREDLIKAADAYFTGLDTENSGTNVPFDPACQRRENGVVTANSKDPKASAMAKLGCKGQFDTGFSVIVTDIRDRRYPVVDEETGLVFSLVFFDHSGQVKEMKTADGSTAPVGSPFNRPMTLEIAEIFKVKSGKIRQIEAVINQVPYRMRPGWSE